MIMVPVRDEYVGQIDALIFHQRLQMVDVLWDVAVTRVDQNSP